MLQMVVAGMLTRPLETISNQKKKMKKNMAETGKEKSKMEEEEKKKAQGVMRKECMETTEMNEVFFEKQNGDIPKQDIKNYFQNPVVRKPHSFQKLIAAVFVMYTYVSYMHTMHSRKVKEGALDGVILRRLHLASIMVFSLQGISFMTANRVGRITPAATTAAKRQREISDGSS